MPQTKLQWKGRDPNGKGRGAGHYWHRGKGIYSKYLGTTDGAVRAEHPLGSERRQMGESGRNMKQKLSPHMGDYSTKKRKNGVNRKVIKGHPMKKRPKGYY